MNSDQWEVVYEASGEFQADILVGMLEAEGIPGFISQEGAGRVFGLTVGRLGRIQVLVPQSELARAKEVVHLFEIGQPDSTNQDQDASFSDQDDQG